LAKKVVFSSSSRLLRPRGPVGDEYELDPYLGCAHGCLFCPGPNRGELDWSREIALHERFADRLRKELSSLQPRRIVIGATSDPYQPLERVYRQTRLALEILALDGLEAAVVTRSDLVLDDLKLIEKLEGSSVALCLSFQDDALREKFEPGAPPIGRRIKALKELKGAGVRTEAFIRPVMPYLTDVPALVESVAPYADRIVVSPLEMESEDGDDWKALSRVLRDYYPPREEAYRKILFSGDHACWEDLRKGLEEPQKKEEEKRRTTIRFEASWRR